MDGMLYLVGLKGGLMELGTCVFESTLVLYS